MVRRDDQLILKNNAPKRTIVESTPARLIGNLQSTCLVTALIVRLAQRLFS